MTHSLHAYYKILLNAVRFVLRHNYVGWRVIFFGKCVRRLEINFCGVIVAPLVGRRSTQSCESR